MIVSFFRLPSLVRPPSAEKAPPTHIMGAPLGGGGAVAEHLDATGGEADAAEGAVGGDANGDGGSGEAAEEDEEEVRQRTDARLSKRYLHLDPGGYFLVRVNRATATVEVAHHPCTVDDTTGLVVDAAGKPVAAKGRLSEDQVRAGGLVIHTTGSDGRVSAGGRCFSSPLNVFHSSPSGQSHVVCRTSACVLQGCQRHPLQADPVGCEVGQQVGEFGERGQQVDRRLS